MGSGPRSIRAWAVGSTRPDVAVPAIDYGNIPKHARAHLNPNDPMALPGHGVRAQVFAYGWLKGMTRPESSRLWCQTVQVTDNCADERDPSDQPRRTSALPRRGIGARRVQGIVELGTHGHAGAPDDLRLRERLP